MLEKVLISGGVLLASIGVIGYLTSGGDTVVTTRDTGEQTTEEQASTSSTAAATGDGERDEGAEPAGEEPEVVEEGVSAFLAQLTESVKGDRSFAIARLGDATLERYGAAQCEAYVTELDDDTFDVTVREVREPEPWDYTTDELTTTIPDAIPVEVERVARGETIIQELHLTRAVDGALRWYSDCGDPQ